MYCTLISTFFQIRKKSGIVQNPTTQFESSTDFGRPRGVPLAYPLGYALIDENQEIGKYEAKTINGVQEILPKNWSKNTYMFFSNDILGFVSWFKKKINLYLPELK